MAVTVPAAPLPRLADAGRAVLRPRDAGEPWRSAVPGWKASLYHQGRHGLAACVAAARHRLASSLTVWCPDYFCNEALGPIRQMGVALRFYAIDERLEPAWERLRGAVRARPGPGLLVIVHYFGRPAPAARAAAFCRDHDLVLVEDAAHTIPDAAGVGSGDFLVFSLRKVLPVPAGGLVLARTSWFPYLPAPGPGNAAASLLWLARRLVQAGLRSTRIPWHYLRPMDAGLHPSPGADATLDVADRGNRFVPDGCDQTARALIAGAWTQLGTIAETRRRRFQDVGRVMSEVDGVVPLWSGADERTCPYAYPLRAAGPSASIVARLQRAGIPASQWPDLPPEIRRSTTTHDEARALADSVLILPVHQDLTDRDLDRLHHVAATAGWRPRGRSATCP